MRKLVKFGKRIYMERKELNKKLDDISMGIWCLCLTTGVFFTFNTRAIFQNTESVQLVGRIILDKK